MEDYDVNQEFLSTEVTKEDLANACEDKYGVLYSKDGKRLLGRKRIAGRYSVKKGTKVICDKAFENCEHLKYTYIPDSVIAIGKNAFSNCEDLKQLIIPDSVTSIGAKAFEKCKWLTEVTIPSNVTEIGSGAFLSCDLTQVNFNATACTASRCSSIFGDNHIFTFNIGANVTIIPAGLFSGCAELNQIIIPKSVTKIEDNAFARCKHLTQVIIPNGVTEIGNGAFSDCRNLKEITIPENVTTIGADAFVYCELLTQVIIPNSVTEIGNRAFSHCKNLKEITIPENVTTIGDGAFYDCSGLNQVNFNARKCTLVCDRNLTFYYGASVFNCGRQISTSIGDNVTVIPDRLFAECKDLMQVTLGKNVIKIGDGAFDECTNLKRLVSNNPIPPSVHPNAFFRLPIETCVLIVPKGTKEAYSQSDNWKKFNKIEEIEDTEEITTISDLTHVTTEEDIINAIEDENGVLYSKDCTRLLKCKNHSITQLSIPDSVTIICDYAFEFCTKLTEIVIPNSVVIIGDGAFEGCERLIEINIPDSVMEIGTYAFYCCTALTKVCIGNGVSQIRDGVFSECVSLKEVTIGNKVKKIGQKAFGGSIYSFISLTSTPPRVQCLPFVGILYVPIGAKDAYLENELWGKAEYIEEIDETRKIVRWHINTEAKDKDLADAIEDEYGALYSHDGKRLLKCRNEFISQYAIKEGTVVICDDAFSSCRQLASINIPSSVMVIGYAAFDRIGYSDPSTLAKITVSKYNKVFCSENGILFSKDMTKLIKFPVGSPFTSYRIPDGVTAIEAGAFEYCKELTQINIPDSVVTIGNCAFSGCELEKVYIGNGISKIDKHAFGECLSNQIKEFVIGNKVTEINLDTSRGGYYIRIEKFFSQCQTPPNVPLDGFPSIYTLYVPVGARDAYNKSYRWGKSSKIEEMAESEETLSEIIVNDINHEIYAPFSVYINEKGIPINLSVSDINSAVDRSIDKLLSLTRLHKLSISDAVYITLKSSNKENPRIVNNISRLQLEENINTVLSPNMVVKIKDYLSDIGAVVPDDFDFSFKGELCVVSFSLNGKDMSIIVNIKGDIITEPCSKVILLSTKKALCTIFSDKISSATEHRIFQCDTINKQFIVNSDGDTSLVDWGNVDLALICRGKIVFKKNRFSKLEKERIKYYVHNYVCNCGTANVPKCPYCEGDLRQNEETGPYECQRCKRVVLGDEIDDSVNYLPLPSQLHILSAMNFSEAFKDEFSIKEDSVKSCDEGDVGDVDNEISKLIGQELFSVYSVAENRFLFPFLPNKVTIEKGEIYIQTEVDEGKNSRGHLYSRVYDPNKLGFWWSHYYCGEVVEHIDHTFIDGPCFGITLLDAFKNHFQKLLEYLDAMHTSDSATMHICNSALNELLAVCGDSEEMRRLITVNDGLFSFEKIRSVDDKLCGNVYYHGVGPNGITVKTFKPFYQGFSFYDVFRFDPDYIFDAVGVYSISDDFMDDIVDAVSDLSGYSELVEAVKEHRQYMKEEQERKWREKLEWEEEMTNYGCESQDDLDRDTYYALGGDDYDEFKRNGGDLDAMMEGLGF